MGAHHPACAVVRCGELRAWCDCGGDKKMNNVFTYRKEYTLTKGYKVEFSLDASALPMAALNAEWSPRVPPQKIIKGKFLEAYRNARDDFIGSLGMKTLVVEQ